MGGNLHFVLEDRARNKELTVHRSLAENATFRVADWYEQQLLLAEARSLRENSLPELDLSSISSDEETWERLTPVVGTIMSDAKTHRQDNGLELFGVQVDRAKYPSLQRNAALVKDKKRIIPKPVVVTMKVNGSPVRALLDSGSFGDFMSTTLSDQLKVKKEPLGSPLTLQLAVQGSRSKVNTRANVQLEYQNIKEQRYLDIINMNSYDLILGTPFMYQHQVCIGLNPARVVIGSDVSLPIKTGGDTKLMAQAISMGGSEIEAAREELRQYALPLCKDVSETDLPPFRDINHTIPLIDPSKTYPWRPSRCPEAFRAQWVEKRDAYLRSGRWRITSAGNTVPMLLIPKPRKNGQPPELRTVVDLRERNKNTHKLTSPLPDMDGMLRRAASHRFRTLMDGKSAYEQIRIIPEHVERSTVTTPDGNMVSEVIQIGDCNAPATYQALMNHLFSAYIGRFMDIYLDDIVIYSDTLKDHVRHVKLVLDILKRERLYLSESKLHFIQPELKILGRVVDDEGIRMDPDKVDSVVAWKVPTNRDLLRGFLGSVGYLADDVPGVRVPMGVLSALTGDTVPFRWTYTEQRAFEDVKRLVQDAREHRRVPLDYQEGAQTIWMVTDGCATGISGLVSQGADWRNARVAAFYSAKLNSAQQNYPVHEIEMLAGIETMLRHRDILQGVKFKWITDHKGLTHLLNQKNLSGRQARWLEKISSFDFEVVYVPGSDNVVADALSRMYSNEQPGTVRARSEYTYHDVVDDDGEVSLEVMPILAGIEAAAAVPRRSRRVVPSADTGRPETSKEFAARMRDRFVLRGPAERKEGGSTAKKTAANVTTTSNVPEDVSAPKEKEAFCLPEPLTLTNLVSSSTEGIDLLKELKGIYVDDPFFDQIIKKPSEFRNFTVENELVYLKEKEHKLLCIPRALINGRSAREIVISEAHSLLAHLGASRTLDYLRNQVWWKDMVSDTKAFCETCMTCKRSKPSNQKPYGLLNPLPVPGHPWESIGVDFVGPLPKSKNRDGEFNSITVVICLLTGMVHLIPSRENYTAIQVAELMFEHVYKLHGLPKNIISDRDVLFTSAFWQRLNKLIGARLRMSSAYHPQTDGATERANRTINQMIRQSINDKQTDWVEKLPAVEFAINSARSESTGYAPFFLNNGRMPRPMIWPYADTSEVASIRNFALKKKLALMAAHDNILSARVKQTRDANRKRQPALFQVNDFVYLSTKHISYPKGLARKLIPKYIGPYRITKEFGNFSYQLDLPSSLKQRGINNAFHASLLRIHLPNDDRLFPGRMDEQVGIGEGTEGEWAIDTILSHRGVRELANFEIKWKSGDISWLPYRDIEDLEPLKAYFDTIGIESIADLPIGGGDPPTEETQLLVGSIFLLEPSLSVTASFKSGRNFTVAFSSSFVLPTVPTLNLLASITTPSDSTMTLRRPEAITVTKFDHP